MFAPVTQKQSRLIAFAKAHGFAAIANIDQVAVCVFIPTYNRDTQERGYEIETVSSIRQARDAFGY